MLAFPPFRLDLDEERLWNGNKLLVLRRKPFAILRYLATNPRRLVTHEELLKQVWGGSVVSESAVRSHLHDLRQALGEGVIETVIGRGYRFAAPIAPEASAPPEAMAAPASEDSPDGALYSRYAVSHALIQEVCEERGSPARRQRWHHAIADYLERTYTGRTAEIAHVLAAHLDKARAPARAIDHYIVAGNQTALRFAALDAVASYERARELLGKLPRTPERDALELKILAMIGQLLIRTPYQRGDPVHVYQRAIELAREVGDVPSQYVGLANLCLRHVVHTELALATQVGDELAALAADHELDPQLVEYGTNVRALTALYRGELAPALVWFDALAGSSATLPPDGGLVHRAALHGANGRASMARADAALVPCLQGAPDRALAEAARRSPRPRGSTIRSAWRSPRTC